MICNVHIVKHACIHSREYTTLVTSKLCYWTQLNKSLYVNVLLNYNNIHNVIQSGYSTKKNSSLVIYSYVSDDMYVCTCDDEYNFISF